MSSGGSRSLLKTLLTEGSFQTQNAFLEKSKQVARENNKESLNMISTPDS